ncbi:hypothetical protein REPUB_Repub03eG0237600 [Reevesia pubescens]
MSFAFIEGIYNGSSISIVGRNPVLNDVREMPIVGGSGVFRLARGYALAHTIWFDYKTGDATEKLKKWRKMLSTIQDVLKDAEQKQLTNEAVKL